MIRRLSLALGLALLAAAPAAAPARADVDVNINMGYGGFYGYDITCREGAWIVDRRFSRVQIMSCAGRRFDYTGKRNGKWYWIKVDRHSGRIVDVRRWYR